MTNTPKPLASGKNFTTVNVGPWTELNQYKLHHPKVPRPARGKLFANKNFKHDFQAA